MKRMWSVLVGVGAVLLGYSGLLAPWWGERAAPQLVHDLVLALSRGGDVALVSRLLGALVVLYALMAALAVLWSACRRGNPWAGTGAMALSVVGILAAWFLLSRGAAWAGAFSAVLGFLLVGTGCYGELQHQAGPWSQARRKAEALWAARAQAARGAAAVVTVAVCRDLVPLSPDAQYPLQARMRAHDDVIFFTEGAIFWLEGTPCEGAREAVNRLRKRFPPDGAACCGLACAAGESVDVAALLEAATRAQAFAALVGAPVQAAADARLPEALRAVIAEAPTDPTLLRNAAVTWEAHARPCQALVVHFAPADLSTALEAEAARVLRVGDHVLPLTPHRLLVLLPSTDAAGGARVQMRLQQHLTAFAGVADGVVAVYRLPVEEFSSGEALVGAALRLPGEAWAEAEVTSS